MASEVVAKEVALAGEAIVPQVGSSFFFDRIPALLMKAGRKTFWPLADQGAVSIGNFFTLIFVARALPQKSEYGLFGLLLECIFYFNTIQSALVIYPLTIKGTNCDKTSLRKMATASLVMTCLIAIPIVLIGFGLATYQKKLMLGVAGAFALVAWQIQELVRRALMAHFRYLAALWGDAVRYLGTGATTWYMWHHGTLTLVNVFIVIGLFATIGLVIQVIQIGLHAIAVKDVIDLGKDFWKMGRWMLLTSLSAVLVSVCGVWTITWFHGADVTGEYYAVGNFTKPVNPLVMTFAGLVVQHSARVYESAGIRAARRAARNLSLLVCVITMPYLLAVIAFPKFAMRLFYGNESHFDNPTGELALRLFAVSFILFVVMSLTGAFLNGIHRTRQNFFAQIFNSVATILVAFPLTIKYGLIGQIVGGTLAASVQLVSMIYFVRKAKS